MKRLIINSDNYGHTPDISRGIREAHLRGVITSTTCMMNIATTAADIVAALEFWCFLSTTLGSILAISFLRSIACLVLTKY